MRLHAPPFFKPCSLRAPFSTSRVNLSDRYTAAHQRSRTVDSGEYLLFGSLSFLLQQTSGNKHRICGVSRCDAGRHREEWPDRPKGS